MEAVKYTCKPNKCISCDTIIHLPGESTIDKKARGVYKELTLELSDKSRMRVGICNVCESHKEDLDKDEMLRAIKEMWENTISNARKELYLSQLE